MRDLSCLEAKGGDFLLFTALGKVNCIYDLPLDALAAKGYHLILADLDNTLVPYGQAVPDQKLMAWKKEIEAHHMQLFVLSNSRSKTRAVTFCQAFDVPFLAHAGKPNAAGFHAAMKQMSCTAEETVMLGDQIFTDILGASRAGVSSILVEPIRLAGNPGRYLRYAAELPFRSRIGRLEL